jgi:hypothetical protein
LSAQSPISISRATLGHDLIYFDLIQVTKPSTFPKFTVTRFNTEHITKQILLKFQASGYAPERCRPVWSMVCENPKNGTGGKMLNSARLARSVC